jgi:hypothetical protein
VVVVRVVLVGHAWEHSAPDQPLTVDRSWPRAVSRDLLPWPRSLAT